METITTKTRISDDGRLVVPVPSALCGSEVEVVVVLQKASTNSSDPGWPPGFFEKVCGSITDEKFERWPQGEADPLPRLE